MIPSAKYGGNLTKEIWGMGLNLTPLNNVVNDVISSDLCSDIHAEAMLMLCR